MTGISTINDLKEFVDDDINFLSYGEYDDFLRCQFALENLNLDYSEFDEDEMNDMAWNWLENNDYLKTPLNELDFNLYPACEYLDGELREDFDTLHDGFYGFVHDEDNAKSIEAHIADKTLVDYLKESLKNVRQNIGDEYYFDSILEDIEDLCE